MFAGTFFWAACLPDFDSRPGKVRDTLLHRRSWPAHLAGQLGYAVNTALRLGESDAVSKARRSVGGFLASPR